MVNEILTVVNLVVNQQQVQEIKKRDSREQIEAVAQAENMSAPYKLKVGYTMQVPKVHMTCSDGTDIEQKGGPMPLAIFVDVDGVSMKGWLNNSPKVNLWGEIDMKTGNFHLKGTQAKNRGKSVSTKQIKGTFEGNGIANGALKMTILEGNKRCIVTGEFVGV